MPVTEVLEVSNGLILDKNVPPFSDTRVILALMYAKDASGYAKDLLQWSGYPNGFKTELVCVHGYREKLEAMLPFWRNVGLDIELKEESATEKVDAE